MSGSYAAMCADYYVNQRLNLKMDVPMRRDNVLSFFDRLRRERPTLDRFRRYASELALESDGQAGGGGAGGGDGEFGGGHEPGGGSAGFGGGGGRHEWVAVRKTSVRSGCVDPETPADAMGLHRVVLETSPYFLDISALDVDHLEILYGFDFRAMGNHDQIVYTALLADSPLAALVGKGGFVPLDAQPHLGIALNESCDLQAHVEVKTRTSAREVRTGDYKEEPISVYLTLRKYGPFKDVRELPGVSAELARLAEEILDQRLIPHMLMPIRDAIASGNL